MKQETPSADPLFAKVEAALRPRGIALDLPTDTHRRLVTEYIGLCVLKPLQEWFLELAQRPAPERAAGAGTPETDEADGVDPEPLIEKLGPFGQVMYEGFVTDRPAEAGRWFLSEASGVLPDDLFADLVFVGMAVLKLGDAAAARRGEAGPFTDGRLGAGLIAVMQDVGRGASESFAGGQPSAAFLGSVDARSFVRQLVRVAERRARAAGMFTDRATTPSPR